MPDRKLEQEKEKVFKQVNLGVEAFDEQYYKYEQSTNPSQRDKLVENIKRECKKLQRLRDTIKGWAAGNDFKDKAPLLEKRELIESKMEAFKAVEKEMKTKAFSKEGLSAAAKLDPKEKEKQETCDLLDELMEELDRQVEACEAESEQLQAQVKKSKRDTTKGERITELEVKIERHKFHLQNLDLLKRQVENDEADVDAVKEAYESVKDYVDNNNEMDFYEDETVYDQFGLDEAGAQYGVHKELDKSISHENTFGDDPSEPISVVPPSVAAAAASSAAASSPGAESKGKSKAAPVAAAATAPTVAPTAAAAAAVAAAAVSAVPDIAGSGASQRRPSQHVRSPMPALASLSNAPQVPSAVAGKENVGMRPAPVPKASGEMLKYASAAAAATAADKAGIGIAPLPPPPGVAATMLSGGSVKSSAQSSPAITSALPAIGRSPAPSHTSLAATTAASVKDEPVSASGNGPTNGEVSGQAHDREEQSQANGVSHDEAAAKETDDSDEVADSEGPEESIFHLPESLRDLVDAYERVKSSALPVTDAAHQRELAKAFELRPSHLDAEKPTHYRPDSTAFYTPPHYPQEPLPILNDPRLFNKIDTDTLFYNFYYRQGTYSQYLAAQALKSQSWRFHKQYQTWFQRHEEPKNITEDYEQGTYRFFDYESTWMNRRKADFKFAYKYLEDDL